MTAVEQYRSKAFGTLSDAPSNARRAIPPPTIIAKPYVPPAVPSPPRLSKRYSPARETRSPQSLSIFDMSSEDSSQWFFTEAELANTPSVLDGLAISEERCRRAKGVNFITQAGILLKLPQLTLATASVFFHRFYMRYSMIPEKGGLHHYVRPQTPLLHPDFFQHHSAPSLQVACISHSQESSRTATNPGTEHRCDCSLPSDKKRRKLSKDQRNSHRSCQSRPKERLSYYR